MLETLSRTKESIGRASRHAIDFEKYSLACELSLINLYNLILLSNLLILIFNNIVISFVLDSVFRVPSKVSLEIAASLSPLTVPGEV